MKTLIKNGMILTTENEFKSDILVVDEKIAAIGKDLSAEGVDKIIDAEGKYVFPGGIDQHVHYSFVYKGSKVRGFETSNAPALGGTTTVIEFVNQVQGKGLLESIEEFKSNDVDGIAMVDYGFHIVMTDPRPEVIEEIPKLAEAGYPTLKLFMAYKGQFFHADDDAIIQALTKGKEAGITVMVHAENGDIVDFLTKKLIAEGKTGTYYHAVSRPPVCEAEATRRAIYLAEMADAPIYIVHVTCKEALDEIRAAYQRGQSVYGETCAHYLLFDESVLDQPNFEGAKYICSPALRTKDHQDHLWEALNKGWLNAVSSDHCGFDFAVQKHMGFGEGKSFADVPNGAPSVQNRVNAVWTYGVCEGKLSRQEFVNVIAASPARVNGLTEKGHIAVGYDADIVVFDPDYRGIMGVANSLEGVDYSIYEGMEQKGRPETVLLRGQVIVENAEYVGEKGQGKLAKGKPFGSAYDKFKKA
ncbi:dihydropyrimidinase [Anaerotignum sp.]|uniref:dihydropyrimidinase n=1 Tax=Anaerotignum sp. TaxID=2039241 RepID=UPI0037363AF8